MNIEEGEIPDEGQPIKKKKNRHSSQQRSMTKVNTKKQYKATPSFETAARSVVGVDADNLMNLFMTFVQDKYEEQRATSEPEAQHVDHAIHDDSALREIIMKQKQVLLT